MNNETTLDLSNADSFGNDIPVIIPGSLEDAHAKLAGLMAAYEDILAKADDLDMRITKLESRLIHPASA